MLEFAFVMPFCMLLFFGIYTCGLSMLRAMEVIVLARDADRLFAKQGANLDFSSAGMQAVLVQIAADLNLQASPGTVYGATSGGSTVIYLTKVIYLDRTVCPDPTTCPNNLQWVATQRIAIGNTSVDRSHFSNPDKTIINSSNGIIAPADYKTNPSAVATLGGVNPYTPANGSNPASGMIPAGECIYIVEATGPGGVAVPGFWDSSKVYSYAMF